MPYLPKFSFNFNKKELRRLPKKQPFICLCNQLLDGVDEQILLEIFQNLGDDFKIITNKKDKGKGHLSTGSKLNVDYFKKLHKTLENAKNVGISTGLLINYSAGKLGNLGKRRSLNQIMKIVEKLELPIVPIRLNSDVHPFF